MPARIEKNKIGVYANGIPMFALPFVFYQNCLETIVGFTFAIDIGSHCMNSSLLAFAKRSAQSTQSE